VSLLSKIFLKPEVIFRETLANVDAISARLSSEAKSGVALFGAAILDDLKKRGVINKKLHISLQSELREWHQKRN
jgi:hypothetical protein